MTSRSPLRRRFGSSRFSAGSERSLEIFPPERYGTADLVRRPGGFLSVPGKLKSATEKGGAPKLTKLLLNVTIERSLGPVHVIISPEKTVEELMKAAVEIYVREKRRPILKETNTKCFALHYSPFSLESLKCDEKLINLGSRNFFLRSNPSLSCACSEEAEMATSKGSLLTVLMHCLL